MDWLVTILVGAFVGWLASLIMRTNARQGLFLDVVVGVVGAALGRGLFSSVLGVQGAAEAGELSLRGVLWGVIGAVALLALLKALNVFRPA
jgi:uncharacterized membrane protein YeaQ/YmgE (transglycosylase-associated protein family)